MTELGVCISGVGAEIPDQVVTTTDLEQRVRLCERFGVERGWLEQVTGVRERRWAEPHVQPSMLATRASRRALEDARLDPLLIDTLVYAGVTRDCLEPATANLVAEAIGARNARVFDLLNACNGLVDGIDVADSLIRTGKARRVLVSTGERASLAVDWQAETFDEMLRAVASLVVGDGGGALVVEQSDDPQRGLRAREFRSDATQWRHAIGGWFGDATHACERCGGILDRALRCDGPAFLRAAVALLQPTMEATMQRTGWRYDELDLVFCHQPTKHFVEHVLAHLDDAAPVARKVWATAARFGNTSTMSLPLAMAEARAAGRLSPGSKILVIAPSSGVSAAAMTMVW
jgi:3-oxoacyl-(acyl-carrier-protein) synthase III